MSETGKQRRSRIQLGYYRKPDAAARRRGRLIVLALVAAGLWIAVAPFWDGRGDTGVRLFQQSRLASRGPLARPHAMWDSTCEACHAPFASINDSRWRPAFVGEPHAADLKCQTCHAGPPHHKSQLERDVPSCAECHSDHRGRDASLLAMADSVCTSCHGDLARHRDPAAGELMTAVKVTKFDIEPAHHPAFTPARDAMGPDSGRILFSHARHMAKGLTTEPKGVTWTFANLDPSDRARYGWATGRDQEAVQLRCDSCHRLDVPGPAAAQAPTTGAAMVPIVYERDCKACHPLAFDAKEPMRRVRHGLKPSEVVEDLRQFYRAQAVLADPVLLGRFVPARPLPGRPQLAASQVERAQQAADERTLVALKRLFGSSSLAGVGADRKLPLGRGGCVECHELKPASRPLVDMAGALELEMKPVIARSTWLESARFNHATHRALECASCHAGVEESSDQSRLILPKPENCVSCHAPATTTNGVSVGGAGVSCVECHRYHDGDDPGRGLGATARRGKLELSVEQFLGGAARPSGGGR